MRRGRLELGRRTQIMGILNLTPDSFSDGGRFASVEAVIDEALRMEDAGAAILDLGAYSSRPGAAEVSVEEERRRLLPVLEALFDRVALPISIDTFRAAIFREAFAAGADLLNDISALEADPEMIEVLVETGAPVCLMHMRGNPQTMQDAPAYRDVRAEVRAYFEERLSVLAASGIDSGRVVLDPGIGFGKTLDHNLALLRDLDYLCGLGCSILVGHSRKSFLGKVLDRSDPREREWATAATSAHLVAAGAQLLRVHDVRATADVISTVEALTRRELE